MLVEDYLRSAAIRAGVPELQGKRKVRFGFHNIHTALKFYAHTKMKAQGHLLEAILHRRVSQAVN